MADSGLLNCSSATPYPHTVPQLGLAPDLEAAWGQPSNQIQTTVRCSLNEEAKEIRKQRVQRPQKNKNNPENSESYTLKLTCTGYAEPSRNLEWERERTPQPRPKHKRGTKRAGHELQPQAKGQADWQLPCGILGGKSCPNLKPE